MNQLSGLLCMSIVYTSLSHPLVKEVTSQEKYENGLLPLPTENLVLVEPLPLPTDPFPVPKQLNESK